MSAIVNSFSTADIGMSEQLGTVPSRTAPIIIIITGPPAVGKTKMALHLEQRYGFPRFTKDDFKEAIFDVLGMPPIDKAQLFGRCAFAVLSLITRTLAKHRATHIVEAFFDPEIDVPFFSEMTNTLGAKVIQIFLHCDAATLEERFTTRARDAKRHPCHNFLELHNQTRAIVRRGKFSPVNIPCELISIDTTNAEAIDYSRIYCAIEAAGERPIE